tara:strand:- start:537 stop:668 length:132 start_codon:yes stop_codon:yes gene_type:complete
LAPVATYDLNAVDAPLTPAADAAGRAYDELMIPIAFEKKRVLK